MGKTAFDMIEADCQGVFCFFCAIYYLYDVKITKKQYFSKRNP